MYTAVRIIESKCSKNLLDLTCRSCSSIGCCTGMSCDAISSVVCLARADYIIYIYSTNIYIYIIYYVKTSPSEKGLCQVSLAPRSQVAPGHRSNGKSGARPCPQFMKQFVRSPSAAGCRPSAFLRMKELKWTAWTPWRPSLNALAAGC